MGEMDSEVSSGATTLIGHYFFVFIPQGWSASTAWMVDLQNNSVSQRWLSDFGEDENYSLNSYGENQMIKFGGETSGRSTSRLVWVTIDSFKPLEIRCQEDISENAPSLSGHTAAIYQDCLYVFGGKDTETDRYTNNKLWCFDIKAKEWRLCETTGEMPGPREGAKSFVRDDCLYIYGGYSGVKKSQKTGVNFTHLFELNFKTMEWKRIRENDPKTGQKCRFISRFSVDVYGDYMLILKNDTEKGDDRLYSCNRRTLGSWSTISMEDIGKIETIGNSVIYKDSLYACITDAKRRRNLSLAILNLESIGLPPPRSPEEEQFSSLFMNEKESDIAFRIRDKVIPAHKKVLIEKCKFFANLFNSGMVESRLEVIDIDDYEYDTFKEFLRFLYCGTINVNHPQAMKLFFLADKYVQDDLRDKCVKVFIHHLTPRNACEMFAFAREHNIALLKTWCLSFFPDRMDLSDLARFIQYLEGQNNPEDEDEDKTLSKKAVDFLLQDFAAVEHQVGTLAIFKMFEDFLIKNISIQNIAKFTKDFGILFVDHISDEGEVFCQGLGDAVFNFVFTNYQSLEEAGEIKNFYSDFCLYFDLYKKQREKSALAHDGKMPIESKTESTNELSQQDNNNNKIQRKALKRMEPSHSTELEEETGPILKKGKQPVDGSI